MPAIDESASALYEGLTSDQLRDLLVAYFGSEKAQALPQKSREQLIAQLNTAPDPSRLAQLAHQIEAVSPYKHCYLFTIQNTSQWTFEHTRRIFRAKFPDLRSRFAPAESAGYEMQIQLFVEDEGNGRLFLKLVHMVDVWETVTQNIDERTKRRTKKRHVVVAQFSPKTSSVIISFPGFTQGLAAGPLNSYTHFASQAQELIQDRLGIEIDAVPLKAASDAVLSDKSADAINLGRKMSMSGIDVSAYSTGEHADFASALSTALAVDGGIDVPTAKIKRLIENVPGDDIHLLWRKFGVITRISVKESPNEVLFVWSKTQPSIVLIDLILGTLLRYQEIEKTDKTREAWKYLENANSQFIIQPFYLTQRFSIDAEQAFELLFQASRNGLLQARYRVSRPLMPEFPNRWVTSLRDIPENVVTSDGEHLSTRNPEVIEIGFERVAR